ncbi:hypothetical protein PC113_g18450 [Phytophthora cactorum]|uniref:Uncharacterized protein n=2 Tax=Phytophthora cactorum TaxID=29920 RepID=A0A8T1BVK0_9STRA|nr:hypothetical protein PC113_g18450 [Phytophthora cactorum]KAG2909443.1 hypothetical protein PC117_g19650 [Phytophthora cactorum]
MNVESISSVKVYQHHVVVVPQIEAALARCFVFRDPYELNRQDIDSLLLTATLWNLESGAELHPRPGTVVDIDEYSNLQLYRDTQCQRTTRLSQLNWERSDGSV